jgi:hypothetical protein
MQPSKQLRNAVRAGFVNQDSSLAEYCRNKGICNSNANKTLLGNRGYNGKRSVELRLELVIASKINVSQLGNPDTQICDKNNLVVNQSCEPKL